MELIQKANKLGYKHYSKLTVEELDNLPSENLDKQIEYYLIQKWLREIHNHYISINDVSEFNELNDKGLKLLYFEYSIKPYKRQYPIFYKDINFKTYEQALEAAISGLLELM